MTRRIYFWATGQDDNVGDVLLRRRMLRTLQRLGDCHIYVGPASEGFVQSLLVDSTRATLYTSFYRWAWAATRTAWSKQWALAFNPGEIRLTGWYARRHLALMPAQVFAKLRRNPVLRAGVGIKDAAISQRSAWGAVLRYSAVLSSINTWRNSPSLELIGIGEVVPDWGFDENLTLPAAGRRRYLAVALRYDRPAPSDGWCRGVSQAAAELGLKVLVVVQVRRDSPRAKELADRHGWLLQDWPHDVGQLQQEIAVRKSYRQSVLVVSDRLHALVMGATEGALPSGLIEHEDVKIASHFAAAGMGQVVLHVAGWSPGQIAAQLARVSRSKEELQQMLETARARVRGCDLAIQALME